jgi:26S proteasome regulatory subunit N5
LRYYDLIVQLALQEENYLEACSAYQEVWDTEEIKADEAKELNVSYRIRDGPANAFPWPTS